MQCALTSHGWFEEGIFGLQWDVNTNSMFGTLGMGIISPTMAKRRKPMA